MLAQDKAQPQKESLPRGARLPRGTWLRGPGTCLVCLFVFLVSASSAAADLLIMRDGRTVGGTLKTCVSDVCQLDARSIPRPTIAWIGLGSKAATPPLVKDQTQDEVHLVDGSVHDGNLVGVSLGVVVVQEGSFDRAKVTWIHLAGAPVQRKGSVPTQEQPPVTNPPPPSPPPQPKGGKPQPPSGGGTPAKPPPTDFVRGALWSGTLEGRFTVTGKDAITVTSVTVDVRLREWVVPLFGRLQGKLVKAGTIVHLEPEGTVVHNKVETTVPPTVCKGEGTVTLTNGPHDPWVGHGSVIYLKTVDVPTPSCEEALVGLAVYHISLGVSGKITATCVYPGGTYTQEYGFMIPGVGKVPRSHDEDQQVRILDRGNGRMQGSYTGIVSAYENWPVEAKWNICREGVDCSSGPAPPTSPSPKKDPCPSTAVADGLYDTCEKQRELEASRLEKVWKQFEEEWGEAEDNIDAFQATIKLCAAWDAAMKVLEFMVGPVEGSAVGGSQMSEEAKETTEAIKLISEITEKMIKGENPLAIAHTGETANLATFQQACEVVAKVLQMMGNSSPEAMGHMLEECSAPLPDNLVHGAEEYVQHLKAALELMPNVEKLVNDINGKDLECLDLQYKAYAACVERARCEKTPESACDAKKPPGNWPPVP